MNEQRLGIIQSRGIGDIIIALPIAGWYRDRGHSIYWPICAEFISHFEHTVPWVNWIPVPTDPRGDFFYNTPRDYLDQLGVTERICLYQSLTGRPEFSQRPEFQVCSFDQYKYAVAQVPFLHKWRLAEYIQRDAAREQALAAQVLTPGVPHVVVHDTGSDHACQLPLADWVPADWQIVQVRELTDCVFDWLGVIESAQALIALDSAVANLVDQLCLTQQLECHWMPRSHIQLTPVLGGVWNCLEPSPDVSKRISIFRSS